MSSFNLANFAINYLTIPMASTGLIVLGFGFWVLMINRHNRLNRDFFVLCGIVASWLVSQAIATSATRLQEALALYRVVWIFALLILPATFAYITGRIGNNKLRAIATPILYALMALFMPTIWTEWFIDSAHVSLYPYAIVPSAGPLNWACFGIFMVVYAWMLIMSLRRLREPNQPESNQRSYRLPFVAMAFAGLCLIDWIEWFGLPVPPVGFIGAFLWISFTTYGVFRYRLFQLTTTVAAPVILETLPGALFAVNMAGEIVITNPGAAAMASLEERAILGHDVRKFLPAADGVLRCAAQNDESASCAQGGTETMLKTADGREIPVSLSTRAIHRPDGTADGLVFIAIEIGELRAQKALAERQKEELAATVEEMRRAQRVLIERENRMVELKREIDELQGNR